MARTTRSIALPLLALLISIFALAYWITTLEGFGATSPGTMVQLRTSHVPTAEDARFYAEDFPRLVRRDITRMTGGDPGPLFSLGGGGGIAMLGRL